MKIKVKLSVMMIAIVVLIAGGIAAIQLMRSSAIAEGISIKRILNLTNVRATYWEGRLGNYLQTLHTLADVFSYYESIPAEDRRNQFRGIMSPVFEENTDFVRMFTIWKPDALDGMDSKFIGRPGTTATGQVCFAFTREHAKTEIITATAAYQAAMNFMNDPNAKDEDVSQPTILNLAGKDTMCVRMMVRIVNHARNEVVGVVGLQLDTAFMQGVVESTMKAYELIHIMAIYSSDGTILAHYKPERINQKVTDADVEYGKEAQNIAKAITDGQQYQAKVFEPDAKEYCVLMFYPIAISDSGTTWTVVIGCLDSFILAEVREMTRFTVILAIIALAAAAVIIYIALSRTTSPITVVAGVLKHVADGDLTNSIDVKSNDEIGELARDFNITMDKMKSMIGNIKTEAANLSNIGNDLASNMVETASAVNQITANIQSVKGRVINQSASVTETKATMEQVVANINSVTKMLVSNSAQVQTLQTASEEGGNGLHEVANDIQEIARESEGLLEINSVIENIASQTNLLSMNAAIEAAHAGEAGKGFAVVADEIRKLAENSSDQSKTIGNVLKKISESIKQITASADNVLTKFAAIDNGVKTVATQEETVRTAMQEQEQGSNQVITESQNLESITHEIEGGMNEMASGADQINSAVNNVNGMTQKNREAIDTLMKEVSKFKVE